MRRILLVHWQETAAQEVADALMKHGFDVWMLNHQSREAMVAVRENPPDGFVIDLDHMPSQGLAIGVWFRQQRNTRHIPILFVGGATDKVERVRKNLPDASFAGWKDFLQVLPGVLDHPPERPVVPGTMDSYSGTPLPKKLGIRAGSKVALLGAPETFPDLLLPLPEDVRILHEPDSTVDIVLLFAGSLHALQEQFGHAVQILAQGGRLWILWPKRTSGVQTDLTEKEVRAFGLNAGYVDYKISAIDETWSGLCFARRKGQKPE